MPDTHDLRGLAQQLAQQLCTELGPPARLSDDYRGYLYVPVLLGSNHILGVFHSTLSRDPLQRMASLLPYLGAMRHSAPDLLHQWPLQQPGSIELALAWARTVMGTSYG